MAWGNDWPAYVPVAERRARAAREVARLRKQGRHIEPVVIEGRRITHSFWGDAWCHHLMQFAELANRVERGRTYVRNGSVCHLAVEQGLVRGMVMGNELYQVELAVKPLQEQRWQRLQRRCAGSVGSLVDLLQGRLSGAVMQQVTDRDEGLFPSPRELAPKCSCPDYTPVCKHVAAIIYGVGARLDTRPELLFVLRGVDHHALVDDQASAVDALTTGREDAARIADDQLADVFGIELDEAPSPDPATQRGTRGSVPEPSPARKPEASRATRKTRARKEAPARASAAGGRGRPVQGAGGRGSGLPSPLLPEHVRALRTRLDLSRAELAELLGMSSAAVGVWERRSSPLELQATSREALERVWGMTPSTARRRLARR